MGFLLSETGRIWLVFSSLLELKLIFEVSAEQGNLSAEQDMFLWNPYQCPADAYVPLFKIDHNLLFWTSPIADFPEEPPLFFNLLCFFLISFTTLQTHWWCGLSLNSSCPVISSVDAQCVEWLLFPG